jgi:hypothetical protein
MFGIVIVMWMIVVRLAELCVWKQGEGVSAVSGETFACGASGGGLAGAFDENGYTAADEFGVVFFGDAILEFEHFLVAAAFDIVGDVIGEEFVGFGTGAGAVFEDKAVFEAAVSDELHAFFEAGFGFAAEAYDEVAGDGAVGDEFADAEHHFAVVFDGVAAFHAFEDIVTAGLSGYVQVFHDLWEIADGLQEVVGHIAWKVGDEADTFDAIDLMELFEEV